MGNLQPAPAQPPKESFLGIPLKGWAVAAVSLIVVCATLAHYAIRVYGDWTEEKQKTGQVTHEKDAANQAKDKLESVNQITSRYTNLITAEMEKHKTDLSAHQVHLHTDGAGETVATYFESDGCIAIRRPGVKLPYLDHPGDNVEWSLGPSFKIQVGAPESVPSSYRLDKPNDWYRTASLNRDRAATLQPSQNEGDESQEQKPPEAAKVQSGCLNPHPWAFQSWWGPANGCFAPMYRKWADGCLHYQVYNSCTGQWDARITWVTCNPNHHQ
jgi:hypothetical protein